MRARGIFPGATVVRGFDWKWKNQDGKGERDGGRVEGREEEEEEGW